VERLERRRGAVSLKPIAPEKPGRGGANIERAEDTGRVVRDYLRGNGALGSAVRPAPWLSKAITR
jgi:hypothetical protein